MNALCRYLKSQKRDLHIAAAASRGVGGKEGDGMKLGPADIVALTLALAIVAFAVPASVILWNYALHGVCP